jgi:hypothetical protein
MSIITFTHILFFGSVISAIVFFIWSDHVEKTSKSGQVIFTIAALASTFVAIFTLEFMGGLEKEKDLVKTFLKEGCLEYSVNAKTGDKIIVSKFPCTISEPSKVLRGDPIDYVD